NRISGVNTPLITHKHSSLSYGLGVILEGKLVDVSRHVITDRKRDAKGMEIEPNFSDTKKVNTGNLVIIQGGGGQIDRLTEVQLENLVTKEDLVNVTGKNFSLAKVEGGTMTKCNFAGNEKAGASWTDKIMANKSDVSNEVGGTGRGSR
uniref:Arpin n=1 Tax=Salmo trutta TaxID=8032 RepID=A0A674CNE3_SALTR